ncbi:hypothetical protein TRP8649_01894 [Pelagimonas phthalicica]|uniref:Nitrile hydratase beta subunit-like N-terminal domain-containing protein n=1 Tax=Pelagimonas phthalicica TaxID=1037362 RepID=A0A238JC47_9RHOB|nr:nitrile hydratase accessory protein [Pelagimonas phthalicica]TDS93693.1 nitrile hydratase accessory protein [Pelagimonas phthalicica]SMX27784.1 hypothetical protein TRP8649_01894 [Pelagimonas phthalicica]
MSAPEPVFEAPWHAQAFALAVHLNAEGVFDWREWTQCFGAVLQEHGVSRELNGGDDYFLAWITALERICAQKQVADAGALAELKAGWERAYLATPHGHPVHLNAGEVKVG